MSQPNILWICTDQQRFDTLGCYGNQFVRTPHADRLAKEGVLFESAYAQNPVCTPSRACFLTGRYPRTTRARQNGQNIPENEVPVTRILSEAGYTCGLSGKLHLSACNPSYCKQTERRINDGYSVFHWSHHPSPDWPANDYQLWLREKGVEFVSRPFGDSKHVRTTMPEEHHQTTWCIQKAINFIEESAERAPDRPWLFSVNIFDPHHAFDPAPEYLERYLDRLDDIPLPNYEEGELNNKPVFQQIDHRGPYGSGARKTDADVPPIPDQEHRLMRAAYWAMCDLIDSQVGRALDALEQTGQRENTIVIFTSDHGEMLGDHGIYFKGPYFYEPAVRVPLIISWPGVIPQNVRSRALVELIDLAPTLLDAAGLERHPGMQGRSLWPLLTGKVDLHHHRDDVYSEYYNSMVGHKDPAAHMTMVRTERYKLVAVHGMELGELYDLEDDPLERYNRWNEPQYAPVKMDMLKRLCDRMAWTVDPLPLRVAGW